MSPGEKNTLSMDGGYDSINEKNKKDPMIKNHVLDSI